jgi:hypothetical protein
MPKGVTAEYVSAQQYNIHDQNQASDSDSEAIRKTKGHHSVIGEKTPHRIREPQKIAMKILQNQRKAPFAEIALAWLAYGTCGRIGPE